MKIKSDTAAQLADAEADNSKALTLLDLANESLKNGVACKDGNAELRRRFERNVYPSLASKTICSVSEHELRNPVRAVIEGEATRHAISLFADIVQMFRWVLALS